MDMGTISRPCAARGRKDRGYVTAFKNRRGLENMSRPRLQNSISWSTRSKTVRGAGSAAIASSNKSARPTASTRASSSTTTSPCSTMSAPLADGWVASTGSAATSASVAADALPINSRIASSALRAQAVMRLRRGKYCNRTEGCASARCKSQPTAARFCSRCLCGYPQISGTTLWRRAWGSSPPRGMETVSARFLAYVRSGRARE